VFGSVPAHVRRRNDSVPAKRKRVVRREGDVIQIALSNDRFSFGRVLLSPLIAFYGKACKSVPALGSILKMPIAFRIWVMNYAIRDGEWPVIGYAPLEPELRRKPDFYKFDSISGKFSIYHPDSTESPATIDECRRLECAAVWDSHHVVDRLDDYFAGRPNKWHLSLTPDVQLERFQRRKGT